MNKVIARVFRINKTVIVHILYVSRDLIGKGVLCEISTNPVITRLVSHACAEIEGGSFRIIGRHDRAYATKGRVITKNFVDTFTAKDVCYDIMRLLLKVNNLDTDIRDSLNTYIREVVVYGKGSYERAIGNCNPDTYRTTMFEYIYGG